MNNEVKSYKLAIFNEHYSFSSDESERYITQAAERIDAYMKNIASQTGLTDIKKIAILAAMRLSSDLIKAEETNKAVQDKELNIIARLEKVLS